MRATRPAWLTALVAALVTLVLTGTARSQDDPPGRVGRVAVMQGSVLWFDHERGQWVEAERNRSVTTGDRLSTAPLGRVELRVGSTVLRLGGASELEVLRLDDERLGFQLHSGSLALRVRSREVAGEIDIVTAEARLQPQRSGHYRFDRIDDTTQAASWRGDLAVEGTAGFVIATGQRAELWRHGPRGELRQTWNALPEDEFSRWVAADDRRDERSASSRYVSPEMTGAEELDRSGRWDRHPDHGAIWFPIEVRPGWAPYRYGRWAWARPWGWTWVDEAPWGFAPFHYGRWTSWNGRWGWVPGVIVARPVFSPALVAWVGGPQVGVSIHFRGPVVGWVPLAPRDVYVPSYRHTPRYRDRVNGLPHASVYGPQRPPWSAAPAAWGNQAVPDAVTMVPRDSLLRRGAIGADSADWRERHRGADWSQLAATAPPPGPAAGALLPPGSPMGPQRPPQMRDQRITAPVLMSSPEPMQVAPPPQGEVMNSPPRPRPEWPGAGDLRRDRVVPIERADRLEQADRTDRSDRGERTERTERNQRDPRNERIERSGPQAPVYRQAPAAAAMSNPPSAMPQAAPAAAPMQPAPPPAIGPARPAAAAPQAPARPPPSERERGRENNIDRDGERQRGGQGRESEPQR